MDSVNWLHAAVHEERFYNWLRKTSWWYVLREVLLSPLTTQQCKDHQFFNHARPGLLDRWLVIHSLLWRNRHACVTSQLPLVLICRHKFPMPPTAGQEPGAETKAEVAEERCLLAGTLWLTLTTLRATTTTSAEVASPSVSWSVPLPIINQEKCTEVCAQANLVGAFSQLRFPFPKRLQLYIMLG